jgi:hypothetical protein
VPQSVLYLAPAGTSTRPTPNETVDTPLEPIQPPPPNPVRLPELVPADMYGPCGPDLPTGVFGGGGRGNDLIR